MSLAMSSAGSGFAPGGITPPEIANEIVNCLVGGAPFAGSLTRRPTSANSTTWPIVEPSGVAWVAEGQPLPVVTLGDKAYNVIPRKLAGTYDLSNELVDDATISVFTLLGEAVRDGAGPELDDGLLHGAGAPEPTGVVALAPETTGASLRAAALTAQAEIGSEGGAADVLALPPAAIATEASREDSTGRPLYDAGFASIGSLRVVPVPKLAADEGLVYDSTRLYLLVRNDFEVEASPHEKFSSDVTVARIKGRFAAAVPCVDKSIRKLTVAAP
jgi:HK97 family phage major capsid protein